MKPKNEKIKFNTEEEFKFYTKRLSECLSSEDRLKGLQMQNYDKYSILFNPEDIEYSLEELEEKLNKLKFIEKEIIRNLLLITE